MKGTVSVLVLFLGIAYGARSQDAARTGPATPNPKVAFLKSLALPGWGHHYADPGDWTRGKYHLAGEAVLVLSYLGFSVHTQNLKQNWWAYGQAEAGVPIKGRSRGFQLAVGDFESLEAYNDYQARSRNWDRLFDDVPENRWQWRDRPARLRYSALRHRFERIDRQLPALLVLMAVNRVISGISAYNRAQEGVGRETAATIWLDGGRGTKGLMAHFRISF